MAEVILKGVKKIYPNGTEALKNFNLNIEDKEFVVLVGPSGCGKSTALRIIAGLEELSEGEVIIGRQVVNNVHPKDRDIAMVFQNYALYPHMTVYNNMAFGLRNRNYSKDEIDKRVIEAADILGIEDYLKKKPRELSGGQRQRVAIGRAIVRQPQVFLFDEPLSNLDAKMRVAMRAEIQRLHNTLETTMVYVTHDQTEAMTMGDRIVVIDKGEIMQVADPHTLYFEPENLFVAGFIGSPQMNFFEGVIENGIFINQDLKLKVNTEMIPSENIIIGVRPEDFALEGDKAEMKGIVELAESLGDVTFLYIRLSEKTVIVKADGSRKFSINQEISIYPKLNMLHFFNKEDSQRIRF